MIICCYFRKQRGTFHNYLLLLPEITWNYSQLFVDTSGSNAELSIIICCYFRKQRETIHNYLLLLSETTRKFSLFLINTWNFLSCFAHSVSFRNVCRCIPTPLVNDPTPPVGRLSLKCDGTRAAETRFRLSAKRTSPFKSVGGRQVSRLLAAEVCASTVLMLDTPCSEVVWRELATNCIHQSI